MRRRLAEGTRIETAPLRNKDFPVIMGLGYSPCLVSTMKSSWKPLQSLW